MGGFSGNDQNCVSEEMKRTILWHGTVLVAGKVVWSEDCSGEGQGGGTAVRKEKASFLFSGYFVSGG